LPIHLRLELVREEKTFASPVITPDGVALGGSVALVLANDGSARFRGHMRATGFPSYQFYVVAVPRTVPSERRDASDTTLSVTFREKGLHVAYLPFMSPICSPARRASGSTRSSATTSPGGRATGRRSARRTRYSIRP